MDVGVEIYWNTDENTYWELYTRKKHICPNRVPNKKSSVTPPTTAAKPTYYNKKGFASQLTKPKMSNSFELLTGSSVSSIQKQYYEYLSDLIRDHNGKVHGSQSHIISSNNISLIVYYEVPEGKREEVKRKFENFLFAVSASRATTK